MRRETVVFVWRGGRYVPAGRLLAIASGRTAAAAFRYGRRYLARDDAVPIDPVQLPLGGHEYATPPDFGLFNGIRDAGPDRWGRYLLDRAFGHGLDELGYVVATPSDRAGALAFGPSPEAGPKPTRPEGEAPIEAGDVPVNLEACLEAVDAVVEDRGANVARLQALLRYGSSMGGARPKCTTWWNKRPCLAKFTTSLDSRDEARIEYATMQLARRCGLDVPDTFVARALGRSVYLVARFDRTEGADGSPWAPVPLISGLTATGQHESDYGAWSYAALAEAVRRLSVSPAEDLRELFSRMVFNILVFNNDDHMRNHAFCGDARQGWRLSPLYDVVPTAVRGEVYMLALRVGAAGKLASLTNAASEAGAFDLTQEQAAARIGELAAVVAGWDAHFAELGVTPDDRAALARSFVVKP